MCLRIFFFFQAEDGIRDVAVTGVQTCALPIYRAGGALSDDLNSGCTGKSASRRPIAIAQGQRRRDRMAARQSILLDSLDRDLPAADFPAREGLREPTAVGFLERDLERNRQPDRRLPGDPWTWRLLGGDPREISLHSVRHLSLRPAVAARRRDPDVRRTFLRVEPAELVAQGVGAGVGRSTGRDRLIDVGRRLRAAFCFTGSVGRAAGYPDARNVRARLWLSTRDCRGTRPPFKATGDPFALRALCRTHPWRSADQPAVHGQRHVSIVHA